LSEPLTTSPARTAQDRGAAPRSAPRPSSREADHPESPGREGDRSATIAAAPFPASRAGRPPPPHRGASAHTTPRPRATGEVFFFAEDFDSPGSPVPDPEVIEPTFSAAELEAMRAEAFQAGSSAAAAEAADADHTAIRETVKAIGAQFAAAHDDLLRHAEQTAATIARLLLGALGTMLPELAAQYGEAELQAVIRAVLPGLFKEPAATVRINPRHAGVTAREVERLDPDLAARLHIVPSEALPPGDVRIAWRNGAASRDAAALWTQITEALGLAGLSPLPAETRELEHAG